MTRKRMEVNPQSPLGYKIKPVCACVYTCWKFSSMSLAFSLGVTDKTHSPTQQTNRNHFLNIVWLCSVKFTILNTKICFNYIIMKLILIIKQKYMTFYYFIQPFNYKIKQKLGCEFQVLVLSLFFLPRWAIRSSAVTTSVWAGSLA